MSNNNNNSNNSNNNPFLSVSCDKCKIPITSDTRFEYLCGHIICRICDTGRSCQYCGHPGVANQHNNNEGPSTSNDICEACEDTALYYCVTCPKLLCERCAHIHSVNATRKDHQVVYLKDYPRQIQDSSVNYDIPENVYLPRKRTPETAGEDIPSSRRRRPQLDRRDTWDRSAETRKPFRKNSAPIKQFSYSKSVSSRASSVHSFQESMDKLSDRSYDKFSMKSEKSVGTDVSGVASMIKNNHFTIMVYTNSEAGSVCSGPPGQIRVVRNADPTAEVEAILSKPDCRDCGKTGSKPAPEDGEYHDHRVYIQRKASTVSSSSSTSFSSHCCESHLGEYSRSKSANPHSLVSKSDTMDNISDILNVSNDLRRAASPRATSQDTRGTSPGLFLVTSEEGNSEPPEEQMVDLYEELFSPNYTTSPPKYEHHSDIPLLSDIDKGTDGFVSSPPVNRSTPENDTKVDILDTYFPSTKSASSKSSISSVDSKPSPGERLPQYSSPGSKEPVKLVDDLLDKYTTPTVETSEIEKLQHSNVTITSDTSEPCMVPQKSTENIPELINRSSPLLERVRKQSLGKDNIEFIDEKLFDTSSEDEEEEPFVGNETYLTHSSHYSGSLEEDNLSNIAEEPSLETCSATEMIERKVSESMTNLQDYIEHNPEHTVEVDGPPIMNRYDVLVIPSDKYTAEPEQGLLVFDDDDPEIMFDVESIGDEGDIDIMVTAQRFITVNTVPNFIGLSEGNDDDDKMSVKSMSSESSKASSKKQFSYSKPTLTHQNKPIKTPLLYSEVLKSKPSNILPDDISNRNPLARSSSGDNLRKSLSKDDLYKSSPEDIVHDTPESMNDVPNQAIKKSPSNGSLSRIPVRRTSRGSSDSKERSRSSSRDSSLEGPRRRSSLDSSGKNSRRTSRSSSGESLSKIPIRRSSLGNKRQSSNEIRRSSSRDSLKSDQSGKPHYSKPPLPRSPSKDGIDKTTDNRRKSSSDSKACQKKNNVPDISPNKIGKHGEGFSTKSTPPKSPLREVYDGIAIKTFSRSTSKDSLSGKSDTSTKRRSSSPSKIPTRMSRSESIESIGRSSVSSRGSFAYKRSGSPKQPKSPSRIPVVKSPSTDRKARYNSTSSNNSEPYSTGQVFSLVSASKDSMISRHSTISNLSQPQPLNGNQLHSASSASSDFASCSKCPPEDILTQAPSSDDYLPHHRKDSSSSSSSHDNPPIVYFDVVGVDHAKPTDEITDQDKLERQSNRSRSSDRSTKSSQSGNSKQSVSSDHSKPTTKTSLIDEDDTVSECSGSSISDNSFLRKHHSAQITYSDSEDSNNPLSTKNIMLERILSGNYGNKGENLGFMDNMSDREGSFAGVSSDGLEKLGSEGAVSEGSVMWREGKVEPLGLTSVEPLSCKHIVIGDAPDAEEANLNTLHFPTMSDYVRWTENQSISGQNFDVDSVGSMRNYDEIEFSDGEKSTLEQELLYKYANYKNQISLGEPTEGRKLEDILSMDEMSLTSSKLGSDHGSNIMSVYSIEELASSSTSTIVDEEETRHVVLYQDAPDGNYGNQDAPDGMFQDAPDGMYPPRYFDPEERSASVASRDLPEERADPVQRSRSQTSISSSLYSAVSKDLGHYADAFNDAMEPHHQPAGIEVDTFNRKYSKRVSALQKANRQQSATLPRNRKSTPSSEDKVRQTYTLPRKQPKEPGALTNFLNQTYSGRVPPSKNSESRLLSRSLTFGSASDYKKFEGDEWARSLPRHLGRKAYMRHPSLRQVDWSVMGRKGTEPGFLMNPTGIAVDEGCVAIAEEGNGRIQIFIEDESEYCINNLVNPCGIALSPKHIYVSDIDTNTIRIFGRNALERAVLGEPGSQKGQFNEPRGIAVNNSNGDLAVCDTENHRVQIFDVQGNFIKTIGKKGKTKGDFREPISCTYDRWGRLLVSDHCNYRVQIFDNNYQYLADFGKYGKSSGEFWGVNGLCSHLNGDILVVDSDNNCLSVHSSDGRFISVFGRRGAERWEFLYPHSVGTDEVGNVYVSDWGNHRIHIMDKKLLPYLELESHML